MFVGVQSGSESVIDALAFGCMAGWRRGVTGSNGFNVAIGPVVDMKASVPGDGIEANEPLPPGETGARLKKESRWGATLVFSSTFGK